MSLKHFLALLPLLIGALWAFYNFFKMCIKEEGWGFVLSAVGAALLVGGWMVFWIVI